MRTHTHRQNANGTLNFIKAAAQAENLALNKPVVTSSTLPGKYGSMAVDGLANTQWSSAAGDHWIWVDLLAEYQLDHVAQLVLQHFGWFPQNCQGGMHDVWSNLGVDTALKLSGLKPCWLSDTQPSTTLEHFNLEPPLHPIATLRSWSFGGAFCPTALIWRPPARVPSVGPQHWWTWSLPWEHSGWSCKGNGHSGWGSTARVAAASKNWRWQGRSQEGEMLNNFGTTHCSCIGPTWPGTAKIGKGLRLF